MRDFRRLLKRVDNWYRGVQRKHADRVPCTVGCRDCCLGLFDISFADAELLRAGLAKADPTTRRDILRRSRKLLQRLRGIGESLEGKSPDEIDAICNVLGPVECPVLGKSGECRLYEYRPLTCRLAGVPVVDRSGEEIYPEGCSRCKLRACDTPRIDFRGLRAEEERVLGRRYGSRAEATLLIPQALAAGDDSRGRRPPR